MEEKKLEEAKKLYLKIKELIGEMPMEDFIDLCEGEKESEMEEPEMEEGEEEMPEPGEPGPKNKMKIALFVSRMKKKPE